MRDNGVKGIKVDFFGGDKQETMRLYEDILSDANEYGLMVIFHGCTLPRGWERMYPNYVGSEAVLASENLVFSQHFNNKEAANATLHPFIRNTVGSMEYGGCFMNNFMNKGNEKRNIQNDLRYFPARHYNYISKCYTEFCTCPQQPYRRAGTLHGILENRTDGMG